jgi:drug/metabolite transporter (DMT)-like permease
VKLQTSNEEGRAVPFLLATTLLWGVSFPLIRALSLAWQQLSPHASSWFLSSAVVALRFLLGGALLAVLSPRSLRGITRSEWTQGIGLGVLCGVGIPWQADGLSYTHASVSAFISQGYCVWLPLYACLSRRRLPSLDLLLSMALVLSGIFLLSGAELGSLRMGRGEIETVVASLFCTAQILWLERPRFRDNRSTTITVLMFVVTGLIVAPVALVSSGGAAPWGQLFGLPRFVETMLVVTVLCTAAPFLLMNHFQKYVPATEAGLIYCAEPLFASGLSLFLPGILAGWMGTQYPNEVPSAALVLGGVLITAANVWTQTRKAPGGAMVVGSG